MKSYKVHVVVEANADKFRPAALRFEKNGYYTSAPPGTTAFMQYWDEELGRCIHGYTTADGEYITGYFYFYLNYARIEKTEEVKKMQSNGKMRTIVRRIDSFPRYYDYDRAFFEAVEAAEENGRHLVVIKKRGAGYSYKASSMMCRNFYCIPRSKSYAIASEAEYLTKDGLLTKAWSMMSFMDINTAFGKKRQKKDTAMHKRASYVIDDDTYGIKSEQGWGSEIMGVSLKNDAQKARGKRGKLILWEEAGKFPNLKEAWQIARPSVEDGTVAFGLMIAYGTGGTEDADYEGLKQLFYEPEGYNALPIENEWDESANGAVGGFFVPQYYNMEGTDKFGVVEEGRKFMDENGNSDVVFTKKFCLVEREKIMTSSSDKTSIDRYIAERPFNPLEATLQIHGNIFPKKDLIRHLAELRNSEKLKDFKQVGDLYFDEKGKVKWEIDIRYKDLTKYRLNPGDDPTGAIVIWEHPKEDPPYGLYVLGCLLPGEKVFTNEGLLNVEDINYTNRLVDKDGDLINIKALLRYNKEDEDTYTLKLSNTYRTTTFTKEHPIYVSDHSLTKQNTIKEDLFKFDFKKVSDIKVGDWIKYPNTYVNKDYLEEYDNHTFRENYWWFIGLWLGDGWCSKNRVYICFDKTNITQIERLKTFVKVYYEVEVYTRDRHGCIECSFSSSRLIKDLNKFGRYTFGKIVPEHIKYDESEIKKNLLLGFLDSDGCIYIDKRGYISLELVSVNLKLLEDFQDIAFSLGLVSNLSKLRDEGKYNINGRTGKQNKAYHLRFGHTDSIKFANMCNFDSRSKLVKIDKENIKIVQNRRKVGCFISEDNKYIYFQIKGIDKSKYTGIVYNFETETHTYCTHHITTHNCDPYDFDKSGTNSLGSAIVYKRFQGFEEYYDLPVAEYTGRPDTADMFYERVRLLAIYYSANILYENEKKGLFDYMFRKNCEYLLADQPDIIKDIVKNSTVKRGKGIHMTTGIKDWGEGAIKDWLIAEYAPGMKNLNKIFSEPLLEELIAYNSEGNFDRVMAFMMVMIYIRELHFVTVKNKKEFEKKSLFRDRLFELNDDNNFYRKFK
jgi:intein/homing endonuclease